MKITPLLFQNSKARTILNFWEKNFFGFGDPECFQSTDCCFVFESYNVQTILVPGLRKFPVLKLGIE